MLDESRAQAIFDKAKKYSSVAEVEIIFSSTNHALTRFANNTIHQNVAELNEVASVRVAFDGKTARATTNRFDDDSLKRAVQLAEGIARVQEPDPERLPLAKAEDGGAGIPSRWFDPTAAITPSARAEAVSKIVDVAKKNKLVTAGIYSSSQSSEAVINSSGLCVFHRQTAAEVSITMLAGDSSGWQKANSPDAGKLDPVSLAEIAAQKARDSRGPKELAPGKYTVILEPAAVLDLMGFMFWDFAGLAIL